MNTYEMKNVLVEEPEKVEKPKMDKTIIGWLILSISMVVEGLVSILAYCLGWNMLVMVLMIGSGSISFVVGAILGVMCFVDPDSMT